jgi:MFS family permease
MGIAPMKLAAARSLPRDLYIAVSARAVSMMGAEIAATALLLQLHDRGAGGWAVAGLLMAGTVPVVLVAPVVGLVIDRCDSRTLILAASVWQTTVCAVLAFVGNPVAILVLVALDSLGLAVTAPSVGSLTRLMVPEERIAVATSLQQGGNIVATLAGPALGGLLFGVTGGARAPLLVDAASFLAITAAALLIRTRRRPKATDRKPRARDGITALFTDPAMAPIMVLAILLVVVGQVTAVTEVFLVRDTFGASALTFGLLTATWVLGSIVGTAFASRLDTVHRILRGVPLAAAVMGAGVAITGLSRSLPAAFPLFMVAGAAGGVVSVGNGAVVMLRAEEAMLGRVLSSFTAVLQSASLLAVALGGVTTGILAPQTVFTLSGGATLLAVAGTAPAFRRARKALLAGTRPVSEISATSPDRPRDGRRGRRARAGG